MQTVANWLGLLRRLGQKAGPYLMVEMLLPGGTLLALLLFLYRRRKPDIGRAAQHAVLVLMHALAGAFPRPHAGYVEGRWTGILYGLGVTLDSATATIHHDQE